MLLGNIYIFCSLRNLDWCVSWLKIHFNLWPLLIPEKHKNENILQSRIALGSQVMNEREKYWRVMMKIKLVFILKFCLYFFFYLFLDTVKGLESWYRLRWIEIKMCIFMILYSLKRYFQNHLKKITVSMTYRYKNM